MSWGARRGVHQETRSMMCNWSMVVHVSSCVCNEYERCLYITPTSTNCCSHQGGNRRKSPPGADFKCGHPVRLTRTPRAGAHLVRVACLADNQPRHTDSMGCANSKSNKAEVDEPSGTVKAGKAPTRVDATEPAAKPVQGRPVEPGEGRRRVDGRAAGE